MLLRSPVPLFVRYLLRRALAPLGLCLVLIPALVFALQAARLGHHLTGAGLDATSVSALLLEEMSFHVYPNQRDVFKLLLAAIVENFGFRQLNSVWKLIGLYRWVVGKKATWGAMTRTASWQAR